MSALNLKGPEQKLEGLITQAVYAVSNSPEFVRRPLEFLTGFGNSLKTSELFRAAKESQSRELKEIASDVAFDYLNGSLLKVFGHCGILFAAGAGVLKFGPADNLPFNIAGTLVAGAGGLLFYGLQRITMFNASHDSSLFWKYWQHYERPTSTVN